jgi:hypothetical protein
MRKDRADFNKTKQNVGTRPGACPMSAANNRLNLFKFEFNYTIERHSPLWAGTRPAPTILPTAIVSPLIEICSNFAFVLFFALFRAFRGQKGFK